MNIRDKSPDEQRKDLEQFTEAIPVGIRNQILSVNQADANPNLLKGDPYPSELRKGLFLKVLRHLRKASSLGKDDKGIDHSILDKQLSALENARQYIQNLSNAKVAGNPLRETQKLAALGLYEWLKSEILNQSLMGHLVQPMGSGKTNTAILFSEMVGGRTIVFAPNNSIADQTAVAFVCHLSKQKTVGMCYGGYQEVEKDILVANFQSAHLWENKVDWKSVRLMVCDEADINALSDQRREWIKAISKKYGIIVVGMSATEQQGSGKKLQDVFPSEIARMPIPDSLPQCLEMGLVPQLKFHDLFLDVEWNVDFKKLQQNKDLTNDEVERLIQSSSWNKMILDHYQENFLAKGWQPGLVIFRNNNLIKNFIKQAKERGIRVAAYTEKESEEERAELRKKVANWELQLLVGSHLLGRGLDIPELNVIYNSTVTYSPQIFWQADGRGCRVNQNALDKVAHLIAVLPRQMKAGDYGDLFPHERPLCHAAFFDPDYFVGEKRLIQIDKNKGVIGAEEGHGNGMKKKIRPPIHQFDLSKCKVIRSTEEVGRVVHGLWIKGPNFQSRADILAEFLDSLDSRELTMKMVFGILHTRNSALKCISKKLKKQDSDQSEKKEFELPSYLQGESLTLPEEKALMKEFTENRNSQDHAMRNRAGRAKNLLVRGHLPLVVSMAKKFVSETVELDDLIQEGMVSLNETIEKFDHHRSCRIASYALISLYRKMERFVDDHSRNVRAPSDIHGNAHQLLRLWEKIENEAGYVQPSHGQGLKELVRANDETTLDLLSEKSGLAREKIKKILEAYWMEEVSLNEADHVVRHSDSFTRQEKEVVTHGDALTYGCEENGTIEFGLDPEKNTVALELRSAVLKQVDNMSKSIGISNISQVKTVMHKRFGLGEEWGNEHVRSEIASIYGVSNSYIDYIERKALSALRHPRFSGTLKEHAGYGMSGGVSPTNFPERTISEFARKELFDRLAKRLGESPRHYHHPFEIKIERGEFLDTRVRKALDANPELMAALYRMERRGGRPDIIAEKHDAFVFVDCTEESSWGRYKWTYEEAEEYAKQIGAELIDGATYEKLQKMGGFDFESHCWVQSSKGHTKAGSHYKKIKRLYQYEKCGMRNMLRVPKFNINELFSGKVHVRPGPLMGLLEDASRALGRETVGKEFFEAGQKRAEEEILMNLYCRWGEGGHMRETLRANPDLLAILSKMELSGGKPEVIAFEEDYYVFADCARELPASRMNWTYEEAKLIAKGIGVELMGDYYYKIIQKIPGLDAKSRTYLLTPKTVKSKGRTRIGSNDYIIDFENRGGVPKHRIGWRGVLRVPRLKSNK